MRLGVKSDQTPTAGGADEVCHSSVRRRFEERTTANASASKTDSSTTTVVAIPRQRTRYQARIAVRLGLPPPAMTMPPPRSTLDARPPARRIAATPAQARSVDVMDGN